MRSQGKASPQTEVQTSQRGGDPHSRPRSEVSIAVLVLAKHLRTGLERAIRGEGGLALAGMAKRASGGRLLLFSSVWRQAERTAKPPGRQ